MCNSSDLQAWIGGEAARACYVANVVVRICSKAGATRLRDSLLQRRDYSNLPSVLVLSAVVLQIELPKLLSK